MTEELQGLLTRIKEEGLEKAQGERETMLADARREAESITEAARKEAAGIVEEARREASLLVSKGQESLRQAARDTLLDLRGELEKRIVGIATAGARQALSDKTGLADLIKKIILAYTDTHGTESNLEILMGKEALADLETLIMADLGDDLRKQVTLAPRAEINAGFQLVFTDESVTYDFTDAALAETLASYLSPRLASMLK